MRRAPATSCVSHGPGAVNLRFRDLPTTGFFPAHCGIVTGGGYDEIDMVGGNVDNAVTMTRIACLPGGFLSTAIFQWLVVLARELRGLGLVRPLGQA